MTVVLWCFHTFACNYSCSTSDVLPSPPRVCVRWPESLSRWNDVSHFYCVCETIERFQAVECGAEALVFQRKQLVALPSLEQLVRHLSCCVCIITHIVSDHPVCVINIFTLRHSKDKQIRNVKSQGVPINVGKNAFVVPGACEVECRLHLLLNTKQGLGVFICCCFSGLSARSNSPPCSLG